MEAHLEAEYELVLRPGLSRAGWILGSAAFLAVLGSLMADRGYEWGWLYLGLAAALSVMAFYVLTAPRMRLRLSPVGFAYGTMRRPWRLQPRD